MIMGMMIGELDSCLKGAVGSFKTASHFLEVAVFSVCFMIPLIQRKFRNAGPSFLLGLFESEQTSSEICKKINKN